MPINTENSTNIRICKSCWIECIDDKNNEIKNHKIVFVNKENFDLPQFLNDSNCFIKCDCSNNKNNNYIKMDFIIYSLVLLSIANIIIYLIYHFYSYKYSLKLNVQSIAYYALHCPILLAPSCKVFCEFQLISLIYSIYKSCLIINLIYFLDGYKIVDFEVESKKTKKIIIILVFAFIELLTTILFLYIGGFFPSLDKFYLFYARNLIRHLVIFVIGIKMLLDKYLNLYRQYRLTRRIRTILTLAYKYKLTLYSKVFIFSFLYCLGFIVINIIQLNYNINKYSNGFEYIYYMDISLEIFFIIIFAIIFFPFNNVSLAVLEANINMFFLSEIKKEKELKINKLSKKIIEENYIKKEYPLILLEPFAKTDYLLKGYQIHLGIANNN